MASCGRYCPHNPPCRAVDNLYDGDGDGPRTVNPGAFQDLPTRLLREAEDTFREDEDDDAGV